MSEKPLQQIALDFIETRSEKSFALLYNRLKPGLRKFVRKYHTDNDVVDEMLAITLSKAFVYADKYDSQWNFSTWIYKICMNECLMEIRRQNVILSYETLMENNASINARNDDDWKVEIDDEVFKQEETIDPVTLYDDVMKEIYGLPQHYKEILEDRIIHKLKYKDIAEQRNLPINTVRSRIHSAKKVIKNLWITKKRKENSNIVDISGIAVLNLNDTDSNRKKKKEILVETGTVIISAHYGSLSGSVDVTEKVKSLISENRSVKSCNRLGGDPCYGKPKSLTVEFIKNNSTVSIILPEGSFFRG